MKKILGFFFLAFALITNAALGADVLLGVYYSVAEDMPHVSPWGYYKIKDLEAWQGKRNGIINMFTGFPKDAQEQIQELNALFQNGVQPVWTNGSIPMVSWMPFAGTNGNWRIANGLHDNYILQMAYRMQKFLAGPDLIYGNGDDRRVYLRLAHEVNGNWYDYSPARHHTKAEAFIKMWRHIHTIFDGLGMGAGSGRLAWVFNVNYSDANAGYPMESLYPGDDVVDWVGIDAYNSSNPFHTSWKSPAQVLDNMYNRLKLKAPSKPIGIQEIATGSFLGGPTLADRIQAKSDWIEEFYTSWLPSTDVKMVLWWNASSNTESEHAVFGGTWGDSTYTISTRTYNTYSTYQTAVGQSFIKTTDLTNPRLLTDNEFLGL